MFPKQVQLRLAADQTSDHGGWNGLGAVGSADDSPCLQRLGPAPDLDRAETLDLDRFERKPPGCRADQDLAGAGGLLEPRSEIDRLPRCEGRLGRVDHDLARFDPDPRLEPEPPDRLENAERRPNRPLRVVLVCLGDTEGSEHRVARELLDDAAVRRHAVRHLVEEAGDATADDLGIRRGDERGRADEVDEQHGCELPLHRSSVETNDRADSILRISAPAPAKPAPPLVVASV